MKISENIAPDHIFEARYYDNYVFLNTFAALKDSLTYTAMQDFDIRYDSTGVACPAGTRDQTDLPVDDTPVVPLLQTLLTRDYCGNHIYRDGTLERVLNDYGYIQDNAYHYYIRDYQDNIRGVVGSTGTLLEVNNYYPYGMQMGQPENPQLQPCKYTGKEFEPTAGLNWLDFHARWYDPALLRTTTQDPAAAEYPAHSPYLWCVGNPVRFVDRNGEKVEFSQDAPLAFKVDYVIAYKYLDLYGAAGYLNELERRENTYIIAPYEGDTYFDHKNSIIYWNSKMALFTENIYVLTPAELLSHEFDHVLDYDDNPETTINRLKQLNNAYGNEEEKRVITGSEQEVAKKIGRLRDGETTRDNHFGTPYKVNYPISSEIEGPTVIK